MSSKTRRHNLPVLDFNLRSKRVWVKLGRFTCTFAEITVGKSSEPGFPKKKPRFRTQIYTGSKRKPSHLFYNFFRNYGCGAILRRNRLFVRIMTVALLIARRGTTKRTKQKKQGWTGKKRGERLDFELKMVHPAGLEPTTYCSGGSRSIQMSYGCTT